MVVHRPFDEDQITSAGAFWKVDRTQIWVHSRESFQCVRRILFGHGYKVQEGDGLALLETVACGYYYSLPAVPGSGMKDDTIQLYYVMLDLDSVFRPAYEVVYLPQDGAIWVRYTGDDIRWSGLHSTKHDATKTADQCRTEFPDAKIKILPVI